MSKDEVYKDRLESITDFQFSKKVANVFDDMLDRSVPFYNEIQRMVAEIAGDFSTDGTNIYDLGCSTGTTLLNLDKSLSKDVNLIGVDDSQDMLDQCKAKFDRFQFSKPYQLIRADLNQGVMVENASVVVMILTLQFIRPLYRETLINAIRRGINTNGCIILVEKVLGEDSIFNRMFIKYYYDMKRRNGYSKLEIAQKREALENVLIPYKLHENRELLLKNGFRYCDVFFKWYNFCGMVAVK